MDMREFLPNPNEKPLDRLPADGGYTSIFRTIACIGDSLSSGEFESRDEEGGVGYHDLFEYSWGQFIARATGAKVYNFSRGGMTAKNYMTEFAESRGFWAPELAAQAYIIAMGVNDLRCIEVGSIDDIDLNDYHNNKDTFAGWYARMIQHYKEIQPRAKFFLVGMPHCIGEPEERALKHTKIVKEIAELFENTYFIDLHEYGPVYDAEFQSKFKLGGHLNPMGYYFTARMIMGYIDYIIRNNPDDFKQVGFIGTDMYYV